MLCQMGRSAAARLQIPDCIFISIHHVKYFCFGFGDLTCASETEERSDGLSQEPTFLANLLTANSNSSGQKRPFLH